MAKIIRTNLKLFGSTGSNGDFGKFGSLAAGTPEFTKDIDEIQSLDAWLKGWGQATIADNRPALEDMNSVLLVAFNQLAYLFQQGIPEWNTDTIYYVNSFVQVTGQIYVSLTNDNQGNAPSSNPSHWSVGIGSLNTPGLPSGMMADFAMASPPSGWLWMDGSAVSRVTYASLFTAIGTVYGAGDGSTTFNIPNHKGRTRVGYDASQTEFDSIGETGGAKTHTLTIPEMPSHTHTFPLYTGAGDIPPVAANGDASLSNTGTTSATGGGGAHNNLQPYIVCLPCIKY